MCGYILLRLRLLSFILRYRAELGVPFKRNPLLSSSSSVPPIPRRHIGRMQYSSSSLLPFSAWQRKGVVGKGKGQTHALTNPSQERWKRSDAADSLLKYGKEEEKERGYKGIIQP